MSDKYAAFVWPAYGVTALGFAWMVLDTLLRARSWRRKVEALEKDAGKEAAP
jgi:heme exporter protein D